MYKALRAVSTRTPEIRAGGNVQSALCSPLAQRLCPSAFQPPGEDSLEAI